MTKPLNIWLLTCMALVALMVFIGGVTRLTESGLSIVEWKLVTGILPPLTQQGWEAELEAYRASPEYQQINKGMSVAQFKQIFWLEWLHRLLGRIVGLAFVLPLIYFAARKRLPPRLGRQMLYACLLVGAQGTLGWLMVYSGLQQDPRVSPLRLAAHLSLAFILFNYLLWLYLSHNHVARHSRESGCPEQRSFWTPAFAGVTVRAITALIFIQIILGAFVAGMDAGLIYNTWPLMDGDFMPPHLYPSPWLESLYAHVPTVQWQHRTLAYGVLAAVLWLCWYTRRDAPKVVWWHLLGLMLLQFMLGIATLVYEVPISLASAHQMVALALLACSVRLCYHYGLCAHKNGRID